MSRISIAMATYNGQRYIKAQLRSILEQTRQPDQVVIFDDCSTDDTADIVRDFIRENGCDGWTLTVGEKNAGFVGNFRRAVRAATGDIVFLCDQDDVWHANKIETVMRLFETNDDICAVNSSFREVDGSGVPIPYKPRMNRANHGLIRGRIQPGACRKFAFSDIVWRNISPGCTAAFRCECAALFDRHFSPHCPHDWAMNIFAAALNGLYFLNEELIDYRLHGGNALGINKLSLVERFSMQTDAQKRLARAEDEAARGEVFVDAGWRDMLGDKDKRVLRRYRALTALRLRIAGEGKLMLWVRAMLHLPDYLKLMGPQGIIDDFKHVLKRH